ncbi:MAG: hypothetical protein ACR2FY_13315 [Pirellulaceae bacterium]
MASQQALRAVCAPARPEVLSMRKGTRLPSVLAITGRAIGAAGLLAMFAGGILLAADWYRSRIPLSIELSPAAPDQSDSDEQHLFLTLSNTGSEPITLVGFEDRLCNDEFCFQLVPPPMGQATLHSNQKIQLRATAYRRNKERGKFSGLGSKAYLNYRGELRELDLPVTLEFAEPQALSRP